MNWQVQSEEEGESWCRLFSCVEVGSTLPFYYFALLKVVLLDLIKKLRGNPRFNIFIVNRKQRGISLWPRWMLTCGSFNIEIQKRSEKNKTVTFRVEITIIKKEKKKRKTEKKEENRKKILLGFSQFIIITK